MNFLHRHWTDWVGFAVNAGWAAYYTFRDGFHWFAAVIAIPGFILAVSFLIRYPLKKQSQGFTASAVAYLSAYALPIALPVYFLFVPPVRSSNPRLLSTAIVLWVAGNALSAVVGWHLRHAFSVVPQARTLVTTGPYSYARHPLYGCYLIRDAGGALLTHSPVFLGAYLAWFVIMIVRIRYEENILTQAFPEYAEYRKRVWMFSPALTKPQKQSAATSATN